MRISCRQAPIFWFDKLMEDVNYDDSTAYQDSGPGSGLQQGTNPH